MAVEIDCAADGLSGQTVCMFDADRSAAPRRGVYVVGRFPAGDRCERLARREWSVSLPA